MIQLYKYLLELCLQKKILANYRVMASSTTGNKKRLIGKQYKFYRSYLKENSFVASLNVIRWGIAGLRKFK